jgi:hypothetical protein
VTRIQLGHSGEPQEPMRPPVRFATYNGDARPSVGELMGPTTMFEMVQVVDAVYDEKTNTTRLGFAYGVPARGAS